MEGHLVRQGCDCGDGNLMLFLQWSLKYSFFASMHKRGGEAQASQKWQTQIAFNCTSVIVGTEKNPMAGSYCVKNKKIVK